MNKNPYVGMLVGILLLGGWVVAGTVGFMVIEEWSLVDSLYMTVITFSTVGFGEVHELSSGGRLFASLLIVGGLGTAIYTFTRLGQLVLEGELLALLGRRKMKNELEKLDDHLVVCGYGRVGKPVVAAMHKDGIPFCIVDRDPALHDQFRERRYVFLIGDATDEDVLRDAGLERARTLLALLPSDADNLYLTVTAKSMNPGINVIARGVDEKADQKLKRGGADRVVSPYDIAAVRVLHAAMKPTVVDLLELVSHPLFMEFTIEEFAVTPASPLNGRTLAEADVRRRYGVIVVAIKRVDGELFFNPDTDERLGAQDIVVAMGTEGDLRKLQNACEMPA